MTRSRLAPLYACVFLLAGARSATSQTPAAVESRVNALLSRMTLEEKVGQMTQLALQSVSSVAGTPTVRVQLDSAKLENALVKRHVGALLNVFNVAMSPEE
jgi:beta-glucosidase